MKKLQHQTRKVHYILHTVPILSISSIILIMFTLSLTIFFTSPSASSLTYQSSSDIDFTINPSINLTLSSSDLIIDNLAPGSASDSNIITVDVSTNAGYGYYLAATANTSSTNTNLIHETSAASFFTSINSNKASLSDFSDNTWGYSYCHNGTNDCTVSTNWVSGNTGNTSTGYNGLPLDNDDSGVTGVKLIDTSSFTISDSIQFKIGAKASSTQVAGIYAGTINFYAITNPSPTTFDDAFASAGKSKYLGYYTMQDMSSSICTAVEPELSSKLIDVRDNQTYTVAKLKDNKCWMTENLNIAGDTAISADTTDVDSSYINSFTTGGNLTKSGTTIVLPASSKSGFDTNNYSYVYNSGNKTSNCADPGCYSYYSWDAATLGSGRSISTENANAQQSICPKGWRLPTTYSGTDSTTDFRALMIAYGGSDSIQKYDNTTSPTGATLFSFIGPNTVPNFILSGAYGSSSLRGNNVISYYWTATSNGSAVGARGFNFYSSTVNVTFANYRMDGFAVRCLSRD